MKEGARRALIVLLGFLVAGWALGAFVAVQLIDTFDYGRSYDTWWRLLLLLVVAASPWVVLARSGWSRIGLAYGVFLIGAVAFFGLCVAGA